MSQTSALTRHSNPFATRWVRPGAIRYRFSRGANIQQLVDRLGELGWSAAIVGPHGSGKTTLLAEVMRIIEPMGIAVQLISLRDGQRSLPATALSEAKRASNHYSTFVSSLFGRPAVLLIVDGYEQLGWWSRRRLCLFCRRQRCGLLLTAHAECSIGDFPIVFRTSCELATVQYLVDHVLPPHRRAICEADIAAAFATAGGNVRETLFALYDLFEDRRRHIAETDAIRL